MRFLSAVTLRASLAIGTVVVLGACMTQPPVDIEAETAALREAIEAYEEAGTNADVEGLLGLYAVGGAMMPPNGPDVVGLDGIRGLIESFTTLANFQFQSATPTVVVSADGSMGYSIATLTLSWEEENGEAVSENLRDVHIWTKGADGTWKLVVDIWNSPDPIE